MKLKKTFAAAAAITLCCVTTCPIITTDNNPTTVVAVDTQNNTLMAAPAMQTETKVLSLNSATAAGDDDVIIVVPELEGETTTFSASVFDDTNDPDHTKNNAIGAGYKITLTKNDGTFEKSATTDANGCIKIEDVPAGQYTATFYGDNGSSVKYMDTSSTVTLTANVGMKMKFYTKSVSDRAMLKFAFCKCVGTTPDTSVKYAVTGAVVQIKNQTTGSTYEGTSDANGIVAFRDIDAGSYSFTVKSMPTGYTAATASGTVNGITKDGQKTMNIPTYVAETLGDLDVTFKIDPWVAVADEGYADQTKIEYSLCKYNNGKHDVVETYTYNQVVKGVTRKFTADERTASWYFDITNPEICGYVSAWVPLMEIGSADTTEKLLYSLSTPKVATNTVTVKADPNTNICIYPQSAGYIGDYDTDIAQIKQTDTDGNVVFEKIPFGEYFVMDTATGSEKPLVVTTDSKTQLIEMPSKSECYVRCYTLYDIYGNRVGTYDGQFDDIKKPETQVGRNAMYTVTCEVGNPYSHVGTAIMSAIIRIDDDGTVTELPGGPIGDGNRDGKFDIEDVRNLQQWLLAVPDVTIENWQMVDFTCDDRLDVFDLCFAKRILLKDVNAQLAAEKEAAEGNQEG